MRHFLELLASPVLAEDSAYDRKVACVLSPKRLPPLDLSTQHDLTQDQRAGSRGGNTFERERTREIFLGTLCKIRYAQHHLSMGESYACSSPEKVAC